MRLFTIPEAAYYCAGFAAEPGDAEGSIDDFRTKRLAIGSVIREGTAPFNQYRSCALREVDRSLFLAASHYRRCLDCLLPGANHWAHVTMYYGSWFAARAILGILGATVLYDCIVDVHSSKPGSLQLVPRSFGNGPSQEPTTHQHSSHRRFWDLFYRATVSLRPVVAPAISAALAPVSGDRLWLSDRRNEVNYSSLAAVREAVAFQASFLPATFPASLAGPLATQYRILEGLIELAFDLASQVSLSSDALAGLLPAGTRGKKISQIVYALRAPSVVRKTIKKAVVK